MRETSWCISADLSMRVPAGAMGLEDKPDAKIKADRRVWGRFCSTQSNRVPVIRSRSNGAKPFPTVLLQLTSLSKSSQLHRSDNPVHTTSDKSKQLRLKAQGGENKYFGAKVAMTYHTDFSESDAPSGPPSNSSPAQGNGAARAMLPKRRLLELRWLWCRSGCASTPRTPRDQWLHAHS